MNNVICDNIRDAVTDVGTEAVPEVSSERELPATGLYVTEKLLNEMRAVSSDLVFCDGLVFGSGIDILSKVLDSWESGFNEFSEFNEFSDFLSSGNGRMRKPVILGTKEEVPEYRKQFKGTGVDESRLREVQLELINSASSGNILENIDKILEITEELKSLCSQLDEKRCSFYVPGKCNEVISAYPVYLNPESGRGCRISGEISELQPGCIMMPYDLEEGSELGFTAEFYQALFHELFQSLVMDRNLE